MHTPEIPDEILKVNAVCIDLCCNGFIFHSNRKLGQIIHQVSPTVVQEYTIVESPQKILYFPVNVKTINSIILKIPNQDGEIVNFRNYTLPLRLHIRRVQNSY